MLEKQQFSVIVLIAIALTCQGYQTYINYEEITEGVNCTKAGFICEDCLTSYNCYQLPNGTWIKEFVENCNDTQSTCLATTGLCTLDENKACDDGGFQCAQTGIFPDPVDCNKYHICAYDPNGTLIDYVEDCSEGYSYDLLTTLCSTIRIANCTPPVPTCTNGNAAGRVMGNPRMYYRCSPGSTIPKLYYCPPDQKYIGNRYHDIHTPYGLLDGKCNGQGDHYLPYCKNYTFCFTPISEPRTESCESYKYFNYNTRECDFFSCSSQFL